MKGFPACQAEEVQLLQTGRVLPPAAAGVRHRRLVDGFVAGLEPDGEGSARLAGVLPKSCA